MTQPRRALVVNADDFGQTPGINDGVTMAAEQGIVTSASLMVRWPAAAPAAAYARSRPDLSLGLHVDLAQWSWDGQGWTGDYVVVDVDDDAAVEQEVAGQLEAFERLTGRAPTHLDAHQHAQRDDPVKTVLIAAGRAAGIPVRLHGPVRYCGAFYGQSGRGEPYPQGITAAGLLAAVDGLGPGCSELGCHPGLGDDAPAQYRIERSTEVAVLCDPAVRAGIAERGVELVSFGDLASLDLGG